MLTVTTVVKTVIGSGILAIPITVSKLGWVMALIIFAGALTLAQMSTMLLLKAKDLSGHSNYASIFYRIKQSRLSKAIGSIVIFLNNVGICTLTMI